MYAQTASTSLVSTSGSLKNSQAGNKSNTFFYFHPIHLSIKIASLLSFLQVIYISSGKVVRDKEELNKIKIIIYFFNLKIFPSINVCTL
jgi:hypothetical protein